MDTYLTDLRYALRKLTRTPGFTIVAVLTLALGIGANSAIFSVVYGVLLRPLPFERPDRLVRINGIIRDHESWANSSPNFLELREGRRSFSDVAAYTEEPLTLTQSGEPTRVDASSVSASFFDVLGVKPLLGRGFTESENEPGRTAVAVIGHAFWQERFGARRDVLGSTITLDGNTVEIVGVMPPGFEYPANAEVWTPLAYDDDFRNDENRGAFWLNVIARLAPNATLTAARAELTSWARSVEERFSASNTNVGATAQSLRESLVGDVRKPLFVLLGAVGFVLLIACANIANLLLARAASRETEFAVRLALGAGRRRLMRQVLSETMLLALAGGVIGLLLAQWGTALLIALQPRDVPRLDEVRIDGAVFAFTAAVALFTGLLFGGLPAFQLSRATLIGALKEGGRGALAARSGARARSTLVVAEMALAVTLLAGAGLLINSFGRLVRVDPGFQPEQTLAFSLYAPPATYEGDPEVTQLYRGVLERIRTLPGVRSAGGVLALPLTGMWMIISFDVAGREPPPPGQQMTTVVRSATPDYFRTVGIPLVTGRDITAEDRADSRPVMVLSQEAVRRYFANEEPLGKTITLGFQHNGQPVSGTVVGVVDDVK
ncbi:MAG: ABC transporter permease, partial [Longimicrobiales bacterium]